jgi:hypothetical protein
MVGTHGISCVLLVRMRKQDAYPHDDILPFWPPHCNFGSRNLQMFRGNLLLPSSSTDPRKINYFLPDYMDGFNRASFHTKITVGSWLEPESEHCVSRSFPSFSAVISSLLWWNLDQTTAVSFHILIIHYHYIPRYCHRRKTNHKSRGTKKSCLSLLTFRCDILLTSSG